jgi:prolipoprotein diacylglyceryltransferase
MAVVEKVVIVYGGELAKDVAEQIVSKKPAEISQDVSLRCASERHPKTLVEIPANTLVCFVMQTVENASSTEEVCVPVLQFLW